MAPPNILLSEENFSCSICLDVFTSPVTLPCGHNFCKACITTHWDGEVQYRCPMCKWLFHTKLELQVNTFISEMVTQFKKSQQVRVECVEPGEVPCDVCTGTKQKALKSCLECVASYCDTHIEPHHRVPGLRRHKLIHPVPNLEDKVCKKHGRPLELFCKTEHTCVCQFCTESDHKFHPVVPVEEEYGVKMAQLGKTESEVEQMIQERQRKIEEIKLSVELRSDDADREEASGAQVFTALMLSIEKCQAEHSEKIQEKLKSIKKDADGLIRELEQEMDKLTNRSSELKQLSLTEDYLHLLKGFQSLNNPPPTRDWTKVELSHLSYAGTLRRALDPLEETLNMEMEKLLEAELKSLQQHEVDLTLDPDTANLYLILSEDEKQVCLGRKKEVQDNPKRFSKCACVLTKQSFSSGRFYFEVQVKEKNNWTLGVASESINRKDDIKLSPKNSCWTIWMRNGNEYEALSRPRLLLSLRTKPQKVGVFVDYDEGLVSFYDVESRVHIYSFTGCTFKEPLYPFFSPCTNDGGKNSAPLIISPINQTD